MTIWKIILPYAYEPYVPYDQAYGRMIVPYGPQDAARCRCQVLRVGRQTF